MAPKQKKEPPQKEKLFSEADVIGMIVSIVVSVLATLATMKCLGRF